MFHSYFLEHPEQRKMTYLQHLRHAWYFGFHLIKGGVALFIHGLVPKLFPDTGSLTVMNMYNMLNNNSKIESKDDKKD